MLQQFYCNRNRAKLTLKYYPLKILLRSMPLILMSLAYWDWRFLREAGARFFVRGLIAQVKYVLEGVKERLRGNTVDPKNWLPWMTHHTLREVLALKASFSSEFE